MTKSVYFIGGGNMAEAIIAALHQKLQTVTIYVEEHQSTRQEILKSKYNVTLKSPEEIAPEVDLLVIAIRPQDDLTGRLESIQRRFSKATTIISIVAGYSISKIEQIIGSDYPIVRTIPNTMTTIDYGYSGIATNSHVDKETIAPFFSTFGKPLYVEEQYLDIITGFYPPNIVYHFYDALTDAGVIAGLPRAISEKIVIDNLVGAVEMIQSRDATPQELININNSPGGVGANLLYELNQKGFAAAIQSAVLRAVSRTKELGGNQDE